MINSPPRLNQHIYFSSTSTSYTTSSAEEFVKRGSTPNQVETTNPLIQDVDFPRSKSTSPQATTVPPMPTPLHKLLILKGGLVKTIKLLCSPSSPYWLR